MRIDEAMYRRVTGREPETKRSKYGAKPTAYEGVVYDSKAEAERAKQLDWLKLSGKVKWWLRQTLVAIGEPGVDKPYRVDFLVGEIEPDGSLSVHAEDVKGVDTDSFRRHVRQWRKRGPFPLHVIRKGTTEIIPKGADS